jgi:hypothetical protein
MTKDTSEVLTECWQILVDYIPRKNHGVAAELFVSYLDSVLDKDELQAITTLDTELADAYSTISEENNDEEDDDDDNDYYDE